MKIMYVAPRYHTNQIDVVKGWLDHGDEVKFVSYYTSPIEDYGVINPIVMGFSPVFEFVNRIYMRLHSDDIYATGFRIKCGYPSISKFRRLLREYAPDVIIFRERSLYTIVGYQLSKKHSKCILYNQSPLYDEPLKTDFKHRLVYKLTPKYRFTPCMGGDGPGREIDDNSSFIPFVVNPNIRPGEKKYFDGGAINILCIGVFEPRKNHMLLIDAISNVIGKVNKAIRLTVIGEASQADQIEFLHTVEQHVSELNMTEVVNIVTNVSRSEMAYYYSKTDLFIIPSTREPASISQLEAMSYSVPAICSNTNGSACYVINGYNGYQFEDNNQIDLEARILDILSEDKNIIDMGRNAYQSIVDNNSFKQYYDGIYQILNKMESME